MNKTDSPKTYLNYFVQISGQLHTPLMWASLTLRLTITIIGVILNLILVMAIMKTK